MTLGESGGDNGVSSQPDGGGRLMPEEIAPTRVFLYGSCVSRDTVQSAPLGTFDLISYVARQSIISAFGPVNLAPESQDRPDSAFQRRMLTWDARSAFPRLLVAAKDRIDLLLLDLTDERLGVIEGPNGGITTRTVERMAIHGPQGSDTGRLIPFGTDEHFTMFGAAVAKLSRLLKEHDLVERTVLVAPPWAELSTEGTSAPDSFGMSPARANALYAPYVEAASSALGQEALGRQLTPRADPGHQWGFAPFHYDAPTYRVLLDDIMSRIRAR